MSDTLVFQGGPLNGQTRSTEVEDSLEDGWSGLWYEPHVADAVRGESRVLHRKAVALSDGWIMRVDLDSTVDLAKRCYVDHHITFEEFEQLVDWAMEAELLNCAADE